MEKWLLFTWMALMAIYIFGFSNSKIRDNTTQDKTRLIFKIFPSVSEFSRKIQFLRGELSNKTLKNFDFFRK